MPGWGIQSSGLCSKPVFHLSWILEWHSLSNQSIHYVENIKMETSGYDQEIGCLSTSSNMAFLSLNSSH